MYLYLLEILTQCLYLLIPIIINIFTTHGITFNIYIYYINVCILNIDEKNYAYQKIFIIQYKVLYGL